MLVTPELVVRAREGDSQAFHDLVSAYRQRILRMIARLIGRPEDVEDVGQEVFTRLFFSLDQLRTPEVFEPWLYRLAVNASYDYLRKSRRRREFRWADMGEQQVISADAAASQIKDEGERQHERVRDLVNDLFEHVSEEDRILLSLKELEGLSLRELEGIYGAKENAIKVRLFRARQRVLKAFETKEKSGEQ